MAEKLFPESDRERILAAIKEAEKETSGEIRVHIESSLEGRPVLDRAADVFVALGMSKTAARNGVLIYLAVQDHEFAILGDKGIDAVVPPDFWVNVRNTMQEQFRNKKFTDGLTQGIKLAGEQLRTHFPYHHEDKDELSNDISFGK